MREELRALFYNVAVLAAVALGTGALWVAFSPVVGIAYASFVLFMLYYLLRRHLCTHCAYYGKVCYTGWGWLASKLFPKGNGNFELGIKLAGVVWGVFLFLPLAAFITLKEWGYLILWVCLGAFFVGDHLGHCVKCPMREACAGLKKMKASTGPIFVLTLLLLAVLAFLLSPMLGTVYVPAGRILAITYGTERGRCGEWVKQGWQYLKYNPDDRVLKFSAQVLGYCDPKGSVFMYGVPEGHRINVYVDYNGMVTRCFCPFYITGAVKIPEDLPAGEYNFVLMFRASSVGMENVIDSKLVKIGGDRRG